MREVTLRNSRGIPKGTPTHYPSGIISEDPSGNTSEEPKGTLKEVLRDA
jgi:hypothetical protein